MVIWICVVVVGAVSLAIRLLPFLLIERSALPARAGTPCSTRAPAHSPHWWCWPCSGVAGAVPTAP